MAGAATTGSLEHAPPGGVAEAGAATTGSLEHAALGGSAEAGATATELLNDENARHPAART